MPIPQNKDELSKAIIDSYEILTNELSNIPAGLTDKKELEGHSKKTFMSVNDLVAYLTGWGQLVLKWNDRKSMGLEVDFPETGFRWNQLGQLAQKFYKDYENNNHKTLVKKLDKTVKETLKLVESKTNTELYIKTWYEKLTLGRMIQLNTFSPYKNATGRLRKWKRLKQIIS